MKYTPNKALTEATRTYSAAFKAMQKAKAAYEKEVRKAWGINQSTAEPSHSG